MKHLPNLLVVIWLVLPACIAWGQEAQSPRKCSVEGPHTEADVQAIEKWCKRYTDAVEAGDLDTYRTFWSEDVIWLPPGAPIIQGIDACMEHHRPAFEQLKQEETFSVQEIKFGDDFTVVRLDYVYNGTPKPNSGAKPAHEVGKAIFLMRREPDGSWIATHCMWNLDSHACRSTEATITREIREDPDR